MAGGTFDKYVGKVRPGTYINFVSGRDADVLMGGVRGTVIIPLPKANYGPAKKYIKLTSASPDAGAPMFGYSIYDNDPNRQMLLIREAFKKATTVYVYIMTEGKQATADITMTVEPAQTIPEEKEAVTKTLKATAKYGGTRGNDLTVTLDANPLGGFDVLVHLGGVKVCEYDGLKTVDELIAMECPYIDFTSEEVDDRRLGEAAGINLANGTDGELTNNDISGFVDTWESVHFNTVAFPFDGEDDEKVNYDTIKQAAFTKIKYMRENMGKGVQVVIPNSGKMDYEGVINVTNSISLDGDDLSIPEACAWVAAATAGADYIESLTYVPYAGATAVVGEKTNEDAVLAINNGEFFFSLSENGDVVVEYDINSLTTFIPKVKDKSYRKNRVIRAHDALQETIQLNFIPNKFNNDDEGWSVMEGIGKTILRQFDDKGAITNVDMDNDFLVDREMSKDDETYFNVGAQFVDSAEKLYFTITTR